MRLVHKSGNSYNGSINQCHLCQFKFSSPTNLSKSFNSFASDVVVNSCCVSFFLSERHIWLVHTNGTELCGICKVKFTQYSFRRHQKLCHPKMVRSDGAKGIKKVSFVIPFCT